MSNPTQLRLAAAPHHNHQLFSDHFLNRTLPQHPQWLALTGEARPVLERLRGILARYTPSENEAQTEQGLIRPVLEVLRHDFEVQAPLGTPLGTKKPDYVFYRNRAALDANKGRVLSEDLLRGAAFAVGDAKHWDLPLDVSLKGRTGGDASRNPSYQIYFYMQHSGVEWGILTNGRVWRLYHKETAHKLDRYYEVDLPELLQSGDVERFLYFYAFFRCEAFEPGPLGVASILRASADYARGVGESLKSQVYEALRHLAQGFLDYPENGLTHEPGTLKQIYDSSLIILYRLLFVLYAEARELLPVRESDSYRDIYSLYALKREVAHGQPLLPNTALLWPRLKTLFSIIDRGSPPLKVATFNGGLFDPRRHPFIERYAVGDAHLQAAIDKLARVGGEFVDYRDLAERHLGTIYEGLLEYHLAPQPEDARRSDGLSVDLLNDKGERKATGSYYTPDYIVKYMADQTLGPVLREAVGRARTDEERVSAVLDLNVLDPAMGSGHFLVEATEYIARFLVEQGIAPEEGEAGGEGELAYWKRRVVQSCIYGVDMNPLAVELAKLSLWLNTVARDRPLSFLDHHLRAGNSLVGARLADLHVRPSAWAGPRERPRSKKARQQEDAGQLTMLDTDAFRQSMMTAVDSMWLIESSPARTVGEVKEQEKLYTGLREELTRKYARLADLATATHFGVRVDPALWQPLADYATGRIVAAPPRLHEWLQTASDASDRLRFFHWELEFPEVFFDRYGNPRRDAGFDAVLGNPPYVRQETLGPLKPYFAAAYSETYHGVADLYVYFYQQGLQLTRPGGRMSYIVTNKWMRAGYGEPLRAYFASQGALEQIIDFGHAPIFEDADVFPCILVLHKPQTTDPDAHPDAGAGARSRPEASHPPRTDRQVRVVAFPRESLGRVELGRYVREYGHALSHGRFTSAAWSLESSAVDDLMEKIRRAGVPLAEYAGVKPYRGVLTGLNEAFLIGTPTRDRLVREDPRSAEIIKPYLRGQDIKRWSPEWQGLWMIVLKSSGDYRWPWSDAKDTAEQVFAQTYPSLYQHLKPFEERLRKRQDKGHHWVTIQPECSIALWWGCGC
ncbi:MAG: N-6 DNA methylase [Chloroflexota bacterium]|nr:N-6 DNA methylase [Chloroflexota bacterium]